MTEPTVKVVTLNSMPQMPIWTRLGYRKKRADREVIRHRYEPIIEQLVSETRVRIFYLEKKFRLRMMSLPLRTIVLPANSSRSGLPVLRPFI